MVPANYMKDYQNSIMGKKVGQVGGNTANTTPPNKVPQQGGNSGNAGKPQRSEQPGGNYWPKTVGKRTM